MIPIGNPIVPAITYPVAAMRTATVAIVAIGLALLLSTFLVRAAPTALSFNCAGLCAVGELMMFFGSTFAGATKWKRSSHAWFCPTSLCFAFLLFASILPAPAVAWRERQFVRDHREYDAIVNGLRKGSFFNNVGYLM